MDPKSQPVKPTSDSGKAKKKSGGAVQIFKVALFMLRRRSKKSKAPVDMGSDKGMWRRLLGSMRPLHIQGNESSPTAIEADMTLTLSKSKEDFEESSMPLSSSSPSPSLSSSSFSHASRSSSFGTSQYASANNLQELDENSDDNDNGGDEMIDAKAEEFIAQFYEQMRRQRRNYWDEMGKKKRFVNQMSLHGEENFYKWRLLHGSFYGLNYCFLWF